MISEQRFVDIQEMAIFAVVNNKVMKKLVLLLATSLIFFAGCEKANPALDPQNYAEDSGTYVDLFKSTKFYICSICGNVVVKFIDSGAANLICCGEEMKQIDPSGEGSENEEKHLPVVECRKDSTIKVIVGSTLHPMTEKHKIVFIYLETTNGGQLAKLNPGSSPETTFHMCEGTPTAVYAYCNLHGLYKKNLRIAEPLSE